MASPTTYRARLHRSAAALVRASVLASTALPGLALAQDAPQAAPRPDAPQESETGIVALPTLVVQAERGDGQTQGYQPLTSSTATLTQMPILDIPQAVNTVTQEVIRDQNATTLDQVLQNVSNVTIANTLGGTQDAFIRRGFGDNRDGGVLTNGLRTVLPRSFNATTDRVEVLKGPASTLYGIQEPGGIINVITKKPLESYAAVLDGSLTSFGGGYADFDLTGPIAGTKLAYRFIGEYQDTNYWRSFGDTEQGILAPSLAYYGEDTVATLAYTHREYSVPFDRGTIFDLTTGKPVPVDRRTRFDEPYNVTNGTSDLVLAGLEHDFSDAWKLKVNYAYSQDVYADNQARVIAYDSATGNLTRRADATQDSTQKDHNLRADLNGTVNVAGMKNELLFGVAYNTYDLLRTDMIRCKNKTGFNIYNPVYGTLPYCTTVSAADSDQTIQQSLYNGYAQDALYLTEQWIVVAGASYQYYTQTAGKGRPFNLNTDADGGEFMPRAGLVYKATDKLSFYANYATSFVPQTSIASYIGTLPPETGVSYEAGVKFEIFRGLTGTAAVFNIEKENVLYTEVIDGESYARTAGKVRSRGFEFDIAGALTDEINLIASYGFTDAKIVEDPDYAGNVPANAARHNYSLFATYDFGKVWGDNKLKIGGGFHGRSAAPGVAANTYWLPAYVVFDAMVAYTIAAPTPVTVQLNVKNLFDTTYYTSSQANNNLGNAIGDPLEAILSARFTF
ncbi:TonB-dependent siderophore receptor [Xanthobacter dioxanivorans]|uniref:TonB-dependent siderophore receptor n=1 Tax=Xanthobacter dioxanivorans TaxID=2528964 RepID=A0A974SI08_9HYPH|nr:TonB-dependent siderophore receptor [Xanthobacter dioxanivorans]QRG06220.1 TonB-dependent siderophore receptor [Xanthobacter dioxanivorans]